MRSVNEASMIGATTKPVGVDFVSDVSNVSSVWKYKKSGKVKHLFTKPEDTVPACGISNIWWSNDFWHDKEEILADLAQCKKCLFTLLSRFLHAGSRST